MALLVVHDRGMRERERVRLPLPQGALDRVLLALGAAALLAVIPMLWMWLLYRSGFGDAAVYVGAIVLGALALGTGILMNRILDEGR
jgi:hypothetical protein